MTDDRVWHVERARQEFDAAYHAERLDVAAIHLRLSALHMARARTLDALAGSAAAPAAEGAPPSGNRLFFPDPL